MRKILFILAFLPLLSLAKVEKIGDTMAVGNDIYMLVSELKGVKQNSIFQQNVAIMRRYADALGVAKEQLNNKDLPESDKENLAMKVKELEDLYMSNNAAMKKYYNFVIDRQYRQDYDDMFVSTYLTDAEVDALKFIDGTDLDLDKIVELDSKKIYRQLRIQGDANVRKFQREIYSFLNRQVELKKLQEDLLSKSDPIEKNNITAKISTLNKSLKETEILLEKEYSMKPNRDYFIELNNCKLYLLLTPEELQGLRK